MGRPSSFTQEIADKICEGISEGKSLRAMLRDDETLPASSTCFRWLAQNKEFSEQYARAREAQADVLFDEILEIADESAFDLTAGKDGLTVNQEVIARSRLRVDARKWMAGKLRPKKYGEKLELAGDPDAPVGITVIERVIVKK